MWLPLQFELCAQEGKTGLLISLQRKLAERDHPKIEEKIPLSKHSLHARHHMSSITIFMIFKIVRKAVKCKLSTLIFDNCIYAICNIGVNYQQRILHREVKMR